MTALASRYPRLQWDTGEQILLVKTLIFIPIYGCDSKACIGGNVHNICVEKATVVSCALHVNLITCYNLGYAFRALVICLMVM